MDNSDHSSCTMTANSDITFMSCNQNAYVFKTTDLFNGDSSTITQSRYNITLGSLPLSAVRNNNEINKQGSITYFNQNNYKAYRVSLSSQSGSIIQEELFTIDSRALGSNLIDDLLITRDLVIVKFSNSTFYSYNRPQQANLVLYNPRAARITYSSVQQLTYQFISVDPSLMQDYYLYSSPNYIATQNVLYQHLIQPRYSNGQISDVAITLINTINLGSMLMTAVKFTNNIVALGCPSCNNYVGRVEFYDRAMLNQGSLVLIRQVQGTSDSLQYGQVIEAIDNGNQLIFYVGSSTSGQQAQRQFYLNALMFQKFQQNNSMGYQLLSQAVKNVVSLPQNGIIVNMVGNSNMLLKYQGNRGIFSVLSCSQSSFYTQDNNNCNACPSQSYPFQLSIQNPTCSNCADIWYSQQKKTTTSYIDAIYDTSCRNFDPKTLPDYNDIINGGGGNNGGGNNGGKNQTDGGQSNSNSGDNGIGGGAIAGIVIGVLAIVAGILVAAYCIRKKRKQESDSQEVREKRIQKQKEKQEKVQQAQANRAAKNKQISEQQSKRIQKKMEKEEIDKIKEQEEKQKQKQKKEEEEKKKKEKEQKELEEKKKQQQQQNNKNNQSQNTNKQGNNVTGVDGPIDLESQYYQKPPLNDSNKIAKRPSGEDAVQDPKDIDVEFSESDYSDEYSDHIDDDDGGDISQERRQPDRIQNIQNRQQQNSNTNTLNTKNLVTTQPQSQSYQNPSYLTNAQVKVQNSHTTNDKNNIKPAIQPVSSNNKNDKDKNSSNSSNNSHDKLEEKKLNSQQSTDDKFRNQTNSNLNSNYKSQGNNNGNSQRPQFNQNNDNSADIIEDEDDSFTESDEE